MKRITAIATTALFLWAVPMATAGGNREAVYSTEGVLPNSGAPVSIEITPGEHYDHKMRILPLIRITNNPQMAIWAETEEGEFIATLFVTERVATQSWRKAPGDDTPKDAIRRPEALPIWSHRSGESPAASAGAASDAAPAADAVTGATPAASFTVHSRLPQREEPIVVYLEVNMSTDFNEAYPADAREESVAYSGGPWGSGQPALIYRATLPGDAEGLEEPVRFELVGHSSPDGSDGVIYDRLDGVTTARDILAEAWVYPETVL